LIDRCFSFSRAGDQYRIGFFALRALAQYAIFRSKPNHENSVPLLDEIIQNFASSIQDNLLVELCVENLVEILVLKLDVSLFSSQIHQIISVVSSAAQSFHDNFKVQQSFLKLSLLQQQVSLDELVAKAVDLLRLDPSNNLALETVRVFGLQNLKCSELSRIELEFLTHFPDDEKAWLSVSSLVSQNQFDPVYVDESWLKIWFTTAPSRLRTQSPETLDAKCFVASLFLSDAEAMSFRKRVQTFLGSSSNFEHCS